MRIAPPARRIRQSRCDNFARWRPSFVRSLLSLSAAAAVCIGANAQSTAASEDNLALTQGVMASAGSAVNTFGNEASHSVGQVATGLVATSDNYILTDSVVWTLPEITSDGPIITGVRPGVGSKDGGETVTVTGYNFLAPGAGPLDIDFEGAFGGGTSIISTTEATTSTPGGVTIFGNPLPKAKVQVTNLVDEHSVDNAFLYKPALTQVDHALVGKPLTLRVYADVGNTLFLVFGQTAPGFGVPIPPFDGSAEVILNPTIFVAGLPMLTDQHVQVINVPNDPALIGAALSFQSLIFTSFAPFAGAFSNPLTVTVF